MDQATKRTVLLIDDEPSHLKLYSWIIEQGGYRALTVLASPSGIELPSADGIDVVALDYRLGPKIHASDVAQRARQRYGSAPILVLSDLGWMPDDMKPFASAFVRKGEPEELLKALGRLTA